MPEEAVVRRPLSRGTSAPRRWSVLPFSSRLTHAEEPGSVPMTQGVAILLSPLEYSHSLPLWDRETMSNMPRTTMEAVIRIATERPYLKHYRDSDALVGAEPIANR